MIFPARSLALFIALLAAPAFAAGAAAEKKKPVSPTRPSTAAVATPANKDYLGAIVIDASDGKVLFEDHADVTALPASVTKLMNLLLNVERLEAGKIHLSDKITVTREIAGMGGTQVFLKEGEVFTVEELLYAMMIQSANDAALAVALHAAGGRDAFVAEMNQRAVQLGMTRTKFVTPHGLASPKQEADVSTPRDIATLSREIVRHSLALKFTSTKTRRFRETPPLEMINHNKLLGNVPGCDGLKTGYLTRAGYSFAATVFRDGKRVIAVVMGSRGIYGRQCATIAHQLIDSALPNASPAPKEMQPVEPEAPSVIPAGAAAEEGGPEEGEESPMVHFQIPGAPAKAPAKK